MKKKKFNPSAQDPKLSKEEMGDRLKGIRERKKLNQKELAQFLNCGPSLISDYERGKVRISGDVAVQLAQALGVTTDELLGAEEMDNPSAGLFRRFKQIEALPQVQQKMILENLEIFMRGLEK